MDAVTAVVLVLGTVVPSLLIAWLCGFVIRRWAPRWGLVDRPGGRKIHAAPTPLGGGIAVWLAVMTSFLAGGLVLAAVQWRPEWRTLLPEFVTPHLPGIASRLGGLLVVLGGGTALMILGLLDDRFGLPWTLRLGVQFVVAGLCVATQGGEWELTAFIPLRPVTWFLSVVWIVAMINSFNMLDNMDGLSAGVAAIAAAMLAAVLLIAPGQTGGPQLFVGGFLLVLAGALAGFLCHNYTPARLFLGDAGSYFVGFCIAVATLVATYTTYESASRHAILAPLCVMAVPLYDMFTVLAIRIHEGRSPFVGDRSHFSHRLVDLGFTRGRAVLTIYLTTATCGLGALVLRQVELSGAVAVVLMIACVLWLIQLIEFTARRKNQS
jgi:UDP-GlcNAc:undecaprenyl-phosphate/decaprenyl-phosphate GlcNAc-1-phosphate transferase